MMNELLRFPRPLMAPDEGGGSVAPASSPSASGGGSTPPSPASSTPPSPGTGAASPSGTESVQKSTSDKGGLRDASDSGGEFAIPDLGMDDLDTIEIPAEETSPSPTPAAEPPPSAPTAEVTAPKTPTQKEPGPQEPTPPVPTEPQKSPEVRMDSPGELAQLLNQNRDKLIQDLATSHFALSPQEVEALQEDAVTAIPRLLAKTHIDAVSTALTHMANLVPKMIEFHMRSTRANEKAQKAFFDANPGLDPTKHGNEVTRLARLYRAANPGASLDDVIRDVGAMAMTTLKVTPPAAPVGKSNGGSPPPFVPAVNSGRGGPPQPVPENPWSGLGRDFD